MADYLASLNRLGFRTPSERRRPARLSTHRRSSWPPVLRFTKLFPLTTTTTTSPSLFFSAFFLFKSSSLSPPPTPLSFLRALGMSFPVLCLHILRRAFWRASLFVRNHCGEGSWHVQVDLREARHPSQFFWVSDFRPPLPLSSLSLRVFYVWAACGTVFVGAAPCRQPRVTSLAEPCRAPTPSPPAPTR